MTRDARVYREDSTTWLDHGQTWVPMRVATAWLQAAQPNAWQRVRHVSALATRHSPHDLTITVDTDYHDDRSQKATWSAATLDELAVDAGQRESLRVHVQRQKCSSLRITIEDSDTGTRTDGEGYSLAGFTLQLGAKRGVAKTAPKAKG